MSLKGVKFSFVFITLLWLFFLYLLINTAVKSGLPTDPVYYVCGAFGIIIGYGVIWMEKRRERIVALHRRLGVMVIGIVIALLLISLGLQFSHDEFVRLVGSGYYFWFGFSLFGFGAYLNLKRWRLSRKQREQGETEGPS